MFKLCKILNVSLHPKSNRLYVCELDIGEVKPIQVISGAPNLNIVLFSVVALPKTKITKDFTIEEVIIREIKSSGLLCSEKELGISDNDSEIIHLPIFTHYLNPDKIINTETKIGRPFFI